MKRYNKQDILNIYAEQTKRAAMGCDIHAYIEVVHKGDQQREFVDDFGHIYLGRNYELFSLMAGVRGGLEPVVGPKGIPTNISPGVHSAFTEWGIDAHTPTWLSLEELFEVRERYEKEGETFVPRTLNAALAAMCELQCFDDNDREIASPRLVFWFDN